MIYFTITELCYSGTAKQKGIDNSPTTAVRANLVTLVNNLLDPLREAWKSPIRVTSGYRCGVLNRAVGGSATSAHLYGCAADIFPINGKITEFKEFCATYFADKKQRFDQAMQHFDESTFSRFVSQSGNYMKYNGKVAMG